MKGDEQLDLLTRVPAEPESPPKDTAKKKRVSKREAKAKTKIVRPAPKRRSRKAPEPTPAWEGATAMWHERKDKWELVEDDLVIAVIREQGDGVFEWITKFAHEHATSLAEAKEFVRKEIER